LEESESSAGEKAGHRAEFAGSSGASQALLAYAVAGVALAAVIASGVMFLSHYPSPAPMQAVEAQPDQTRQAPLRLVSPRAITAEEMRDGGLAAATEEPPAPPPPAAPGEPRLAKTEGLDTERVTDTADFPEPSVAQVGPAAEPPVEEQVGGSTAAQGLAQPKSRLVSTTLRSETMDSQAPPVAELALADSEESAEVLEPAPSEKTREPALEQLPNPGERQTSANANGQGTPVDDEALPPAPVAEPPAEVPGYSYPGSRRLYAPPMPPYPPPFPPYMRRNPGHAGGYYRMDTTASVD
jgi:hypothetical protein